MKLTNMEMLELAVSMGKRAYDRNSYFSVRSASAFNRVLKKIRHDAYGRSNCKQIIRAIGDVLEDEG